ncbi:pyruvate dehydrogenase complex subunit PDH-E2 [Besnoitia besnoiti]|uniref:Dihydrolipoamide acetyltransferase component of pyruvate dehydrogenase complex n=1 Tax=Besnoitia besnoiti TaxID=94643 RepID=A0A2A9MK72_BESBE|nr:pyruvate dehydrogenase complex subunit PDH-E2 [Besnoitia besnoiti]PFH36007.1 pyruvate dehydrogenase complex subunit PDH-E2 [Besnoitia besnoiti]
MATATAPPRASVCECFASRLLYATQRRRPHASPPACRVSLVALLCLASAFFSAAGLQLSQPPSPNTLASSRTAAFISVSPHVSLSSSTCQNASDSSTVLASSSSSARRPRAAPPTCSTPLQGRRKRREGATQPVQSLYASERGGSADGSRGGLSRLHAGASGELAGAVQEILMPALSSTMKEGKIVSWAKQVGDRVEPGDVLMVVESDKADMDVEAFDSGFVATHLVREGEAAPVGTPVGLLAEREEDIPLIQDKGMSILSSGTSSLTPSPVSELLMPSLSPSMKTGHIAVWKKKEGDRVKKGEVLFIVESDKADMDVEAPHDGVLAHIAVGAGVSTSLGTVVGYLAADAESASAFKQQVSASPSSFGEAIENPSRMPEGTQEIFMPALSSTMTSGKISKWNKAVGDEVHVGDTLMVVESDKADMDVECFEEGYLAAITVQEGESAPVGQTVAIVVPSKDDVPKVQEALKQAASPRALSPSPPASPLPSVALPSSPASSPAAAARASPAAQEPRGLSATGVRTEAFRRHTAALESWTAPPVDQDVKDQLPGGLTGADLQQELLRRIQDTLPATAAALQEKPQIQQALMDRVNLRVPPPHTLRVAQAPPPYLQRAVSTYGGGHAGAAEKTDPRGSRTSATGVARDPSGLPLATFNASELAKKHKLNLEEVRGTGTNRRITAADVRRHLQLPSEEATILAGVTGEARKTTERMSGVPPTGSVALDTMQKAIARNMEATVNVPVFRVSRGIYVEKLEALLHELKQVVAEQNAAAVAAEGEDAVQHPPVTMSVLLAKAVALTLQKHPIMNAAFNPRDGGVIQHPGTVNLAMAVSIDGGLLTPVLRDVNTKSVFELAKDWSGLVDKARKRRLTPAENSTGTFYISNLGMFGVSQFDAVLPTGVGTIMAIGATETVPFARKTGAVEASASRLDLRRRMTVTVTCDHRHIYGSHAAAFLEDFATLLETRPSALLL